MGFRRDPDCVWQLRCQVIHKGPDRGQKAAPVGHESREHGIAGKPARQHLALRSRPDIIATDITRQGDDAETGDRCLLQNH